MTPCCGSDVAGGLDGYEILKLHDADPFLGVELKFMDISPCRRFLDSYSCGSLLQFLSQHASRLLSIPDGVSVEAMLKAGTYTLDHSLQDQERCLQLIYQSQVLTHSLTHSQSRTRSHSLNHANTHSLTLIPSHAHTHSIMQTLTLSLKLIPSLHHKNNLKSKINK